MEAYCELVKSCLRCRVVLSDDMGVWIFGAIWILGWACIPHLLLLNKRPTATLAWLWAILLFPVIGPSLYLMIGTELVKRRRLKRRRDFRGKKKWAAARSDAAATSARVAGEKALASDDLFLLNQLAAITQLPITTVSSIRILHKAPSFYEALRHDIEHAQREVHIQSYIWRDDEVGKDLLEILMAAVRRGVTVRVLIDEAGIPPLEKGLFQSLS